jgi:hypothetical protein
MNDVNKIKKFMTKPNVNMKMDNLKMLLDISKDIGHDNKGEDITVDYDNVNLVNHIPFADTNTKPQSFNTSYAHSHS